MGRADRSTVFRTIALVASAVRRPFASLTLVGQELDHSRGPMIYAANHRSFFDIVVGFEFFHRIGDYPTIIVNRRYFSHPVLGRVLRRLRSIPAERGELDALVASATREMAMGHSVAIFPEGRLLDAPAGDPLSARVGRSVAVIARNTGRPVIPLGITGTGDIWPIGRILPSVRVPRRSAIVHIGTPHYVGTDDEATEAHKVLNAILLLAGEVQ